MSELERKVEQLVLQQSAMSIQMQEQIKHQQETSQQISKLAEAMVSIARMEVSTNNLVDKLNGFGRRVSRNEDELKALALQVALNGQQTGVMGKWVERMVWFVVAAAAASLNLFKPGE